MEVLILLTLLIALDLAAWRWGHDSRDGHDSNGQGVRARHLSGR